MLKISLLNLYISNPLDRGECSCVHPRTTFWVFKTLLPFVLFPAKKCFSYYKSMFMLLLCWWLSRLYTCSGSKAWVYSSCLWTLVNCFSYSDDFSADYSGHPSVPSLYLLQQISTPLTDTIWEPIAACSSLAPGGPTEPVSLGLAESLCDQGQPMWLLPVSSGSVGTPDASDETSQVSCLCLTPFPLSTFDLYSTTTSQSPLWSNQRLCCPYHHQQQQQESGMLGLTGSLCVQKWAQAGL